MTLVTALCTVACGGDDSKNPSNAALDPPTNAPAQGCDAIELEPPKPGEGIQLSVDIPLGPGEEREYCKLVLAGETVRLNYSEGLFTSGSHHGLIWGTSYRDALPTENIRGEVVDTSRALPCDTPSADWNVTTVLAGGSRVGSSRASSDVLGKGVLPGNVALKIEANQVLLVNFHMLNAKTEPVHACYKANLYGIPEDQVEAEAGTIFFYNNFITVPPRGSFSAEMACPVTHDLSLASAVSHMHARGISYASSLLDGDPLTGGAEVRKLHESSDWKEPVADIFSPALPLKAGQWIKWSCGFENPEDRGIAQGFQTTDEMCMFVGAYWPRSPRMDFCLNNAGTGQAGRNPSTGNKAGAEFADCWAKSPKVVRGGGPDTSEARYATQRCVTESCPKVSARVNEAAQGLVDITSVTCD